MTRLLLIPAAIVLLSAPLAALPPFMPVGERIRLSDAVLVGVISESEDIEINSRTASAKVNLQVKQVLYNKTGHKVPRNFSMQYLVWPESVETVRSAPPEGKYFFFLKEEYVRIASGKSVLIYIPIDPRPFAFHEFSEDQLRQIQKEISGL